MTHYSKKEAIFFVPKRYVTKKILGADGFILVQGILLMWKKCQKLLSGYCIVNAKCFNYFVNVLKLFKNFHLATLAKSIGLRWWWRRTLPRINFQRKILEVKSSDTCPYGYLFCFVVHATAQLFRWEMKIKWESSCFNVKTILTLFTKTTPHIILFSGTKCLRYV